MRIGTLCQKQKRQCRSSHKSLHAAEAFLQDWHKLQYWRRMQQRTATVKFLRKIRILQQSFSRPFSHDVMAAPEQLRDSERLLYRTILSEGVRL